MIVKTGYAVQNHRQPPRVNRNSIVEGALSLAHTADEAGDRAQTAAAAACREYAGAATATAADSSRGGT